MKVPSSSSILLATLAVSSSSSALVPPSSDTHQEAPLSSASSALIPSSSSGSLAPHQTGFSQREFALDSVEQRAILDNILPLACQLAHTLTDNLPTPIPALVGVLCSPTPKDSKGSPNQAKAHKELSKISDTLQQAVFVSGASVPPSTPPVDGDNSRVNAASSASFVPTSSESLSASLIPSSAPAALPSANRVDGDNSRVNATNSASLVPTPSSASLIPSSSSSNGDNSRVNATSHVATPSDSSAVSLMPSVSSTAWRFQPTPANSPSLSTDDLEGR